jgi:hypothetical protein
MEPRGCQKLRLSVPVYGQRKVTVILLSLLSFIFISPGLKDKFLLNIFPAPCGYSFKIAVHIIEAVKIKPK